MKKLLLNIFKSLGLCIFLASCNIKNSYNNGPETPVGPSQIELENELCVRSGQDKFDIDGFNSMFVSEELADRKRQLSGAAMVFLNVIPVSSLIETYGGLIHVCLNKNISLEIGCAGRDLRLTENGIEKDTSMEQLLAKIEAVQVDYLKICGPLKLSDKNILLLVTKKLEFINASLELKDESFLSISTYKIVNPSGLVKVDLDPKAIMSVYSTDDVKH